MPNTRRRLILITTAILVLTFFVHPTQRVFAESCSAGAVVWGNSVGGYTGECWSGEQYYEHAYTYSKPATSYVTLKAWVQWWETCDGVYAGGSSAGVITKYNANWVQVKGPWHGYYCTGTQTHQYFGRGQHTNSTSNEVVYSNIP